MNYTKIFYLLAVFTLIILFSAKNAQSQDTISVMQYNLLFYGLFTDFCTENNNNIDNKDEYLRTILGHFQPEILAVNELGGGVQNLSRIRDSVLNVNGVDYFENATYTNTGNGWFANGLFYDSRKFGLYDEVIVNSLLRDINLYTLYYKSDDLEFTKDTVFITVLVAHLKAGQTAEDQQTRTVMVSNAMNYLNNNNYSGNILFIGDFNMRSSFEQAYQIMVNNANPNIQLFDPVDKPGVWGNNSDMALYHTQSPRTGSHPCFVTGGFDDRYDFILATKSIMEGLNGFSYIEDSYQAIGQDGNRFNQSLINPANDSQPPEIINALYNMSDHLPVMLDMLVVDLQSSAEENYFKKFEINYNNPVSATLEIKINSELLHEDKIEFEIYSVSGTLLMSNQLRKSQSGGKFSIDTSFLKPGIYLLRFTIRDGYTYSGKLIKI